MKIMTWTKRIILTVSFLALIATNLLTLTHTAFNAAVSGLMSTAFGIQTVSSVLQGQIDTHKTKMAARKKATKLFGGRVTVRTKRLVATTIAELPAEAIPILGITVLVGATAHEIKMACENLDDLSELYRDMGIEEEVDRGVMVSVCHPPLPSIEELRVYVNDYLD